FAVLRRVEQSDDGVPGHGSSLLVETDAGRPSPSRSSRVVARVHVDEHHALDLNGVRTGANAGGGLRGQLLAGPDVGAPLRAVHEELVVGFERDLDGDVTVVHGDPGVLELDPPPEVVRPLAEATLTRTNQQPPVRLW